MDLTRFLGSYKIDTEHGAPHTQPAAGAPSQSAPEHGDDSVRELLSEFGRMSFNNGLYRTHRPEDVPEWNRTIATAWIRG